MAGDKLEIQVEADTASAQKGIKGLADDLKDVGKAAEDANSAAAKASDDLAASLKGVKDALPTSGDAKGIEDINTATLNASKSTAITETAFQKLGRTLSGLGRTAASSLSSAFSGLSGIASTAGRAIGTALAAGFSATAIGAFVVIVATLYKKLQDFITFAATAGKRAGQALTDAFSAGMTLPDFRAFEGLFRGFGVGADDANKLAVAIGAIREQALQGGDKADRLAGILKLLGTDISAFTGTAEDAANGLFKIRDGFQQLDPLRRREILQGLFPGVKTDTLAQLDNALMNTNKTTLDVISTLRQYQQQQGQVDQSTSAMAQAWTKATTSLSNFWNNLSEVTGANALYKSSIDQTIQALNGISGVLDILSSKVVTWAADFKAKMADMWDKIFNLPGDVKSKAIADWTALMQSITDAVTAGGTAITEAWQSIVDSIKAIWDTMAGAAQAAIDKVISIFTSGLAKLKSIGSAMNPSNWFGGGSTTPTPERRAMPIMPQTQRASPFLMRMAGVSATNLATGLAAPMALGAANSNNATAIGSAAWSKSLDDLIFRYKEVKKAADDAGAAGKKAGTDSATGANTASTAWNQLPTAQEIAIENFKLMQQMADDMNRQFASFGEQAVLSFVDAAMAGEDLRDVLAGLLKDLAKLILQQYVLKPLFGSLFPSSSGFSAPMAAMSAGGPVAAGTSMMAANANMLGAASPTSAISGLSNIQGRASLSATTPTGAAGVTNNVGDINVDMSQTGKVTGSTEDAKKLGLQIQKAVQVVLVQESRPGGLLRQGAA